MECQQFLSIFKKVLRKHATMKCKSIRANKEVWSKLERFHVQKPQGNFNKKIKAMQYIFEGESRKSEKSL